MLFPRSLFNRPFTPPLRMKILWLMTQGRKKAVVTSYGCVMGGLALPFMLDLKVSHFVKQGKGQREKREERREKREDHNMEVTYVCFEFKVG